MDIIRYHYPDVTILQEPPVYINPRFTDPDRFHRMTRSFETDRRKPVPSFLRSADFLYLNKYRPRRSVQSVVIVPLRSFFGYDCLRPTSQYCAAASELFSAMNLHTAGLIDSHQLDHFWKTGSYY